MRIAIGQFNATIGAFGSNVEKIRTLGRRALAEGAELLLLPEQSIPGYPARDFLDLPEFVQGNVAALEQLRSDPDLQELAVLVGYAEPHGGVGAGLYNSVAFLHGGAEKATARKLLLPTYDVFDEGRYFDAGSDVVLVDHGGIRVAVTICEDIWNDKIFWQRRRYERDPIEEAVGRGAQLVLNLSASPFIIGKPALRERMLGAAARRHRVPIVYCNLVGGNDSLVFDGRSLVIGADGKVLHRGAHFAEDFLVVDVKPAAVHEPGEPYRAEAALPVPGASVSAEDLDQLHDALTLGLRDYCARTGFRSVLLGLSGGIDSALTAAIAARALGPENVLGVAMPSRYTSAMSNEDAEALARNLGIRFESVPIEKAYGAFTETLAPLFAGTQPDLTEENLQARSRGVILMALSNKFGSLLLTTGNKSEIGVGYCTLYGDMAGGLAVIGDLPKTLVYQLSRHLNREREVIPERIITRPPSAELRENQTDQDSLPPYEVLDRILRGYVLEKRSVAELVAQGDDEATVRRVLSLVIASEYKRRQGAPNLKVTPRAFGEGWRFPIAHRFRYR
ncbi:NAD+ synthase [Vulgatibacter sp.]|uniref:NAD+ synthase n=1 Tax=Vulgatibacter sp. TaxID=1971226 RepID=UPI0035678DD5